MNRSFDTTLRLKDSMLRPGDRVYIDGVFENGAFEQGIVKEVHTNNVLVNVASTSGTDERTYSHESLRFSPLTSARSRFFPR